MAKSNNPFVELIKVLKHNGFTMNTLLTEIPGPQFFNRSKPAGIKHGLVQVRPIF